MFMLAGLGLCLSVSGLRNFSAIPGDLVQARHWPSLSGLAAASVFREGKDTLSRHMALHVCLERSVFE